MPIGTRYIPLKGINLDIADSLMPQDQARFIKNLIYELGDSSTSTTSQSGQAGVFKNIPTNAKYISNLTLPAGYNQTIGAFSFKEINQIFVFVYNDKGNHTIYRLNGSNQTFNIVKQGSVLNFQINPENFIHQGGCEMVVVVQSDPTSEDETMRSFICYTDNFNPQRFFCVDDCVATNGFNPATFNYFQGTYDPMILFNMGVPTPTDCIQINEVPLDTTAQALVNKLLFNTWQFRIRYYDVWGRPSEYGLISDIYIPGSGNCVNTSSNLPRCLNLLFNFPFPLIDKIEIAYRNCNDDQWYTIEVINLYNGSPLGQWWTRAINPLINYNASTGKITYQFCADKECNAIAPADADRVENPIPRTSMSVAQVGNFFGLANNKDGFNPFSQDLLNQITFTVEPPSPTTTNNLSNIEIYVAIVNPLYFDAQGVVFYAPVEKQYYFGVYPSPQHVDYKQFFKNPNQAGFIGVLAGTNSYVISEQYQVDRNGVFSKVTNFTVFDFNNFRYYQRFYFSNVPKGNYVFRIAGLTVDPTTDSFDTVTKSSTYTAGLFSFSQGTALLNINPNNNVNGYAKELIVNTCNGDYSTLDDDKLLLIYDFAVPIKLLDKPVEQGYVYNTNDTTQDQIGVELLLISAGGASISSKFTDHNGYYFITSPTQEFTWQFYGFCDCKRIAFFGARAPNAIGQFTNNFYLNLSTGTTIPFTNFTSGGCPDYSTSVCNYILIKGVVTECGTTVGVPNVSVVMSRGGQATTGSDGSFTMIVYDDAYNNAPRVDTLYYISNGCPFTDCNGDCVTPQQVTIQLCVTCQARTVNVNGVSIVIPVNKGLLSGGVYPKGVQGHDWLGRGGFIQDLGYIDIPSVQQTKVFAPSRVRVNINPAAIFPSEFTYLTFYVGTETTIQTYITWLVDNVLFIDNTGLVNNTAPTQIKIYYQSLNLYNQENNFNTTDNWQFLEPLPSTAAAGTAQTPYTTDTVQFLINGDGTFFPKAITALVKYDQTGEYFLIDYTPDLAKLLPNAIVRLVRPKSCTGTEPEFEICFVVPLVNGVATITSFYLNAFDTYYLYRQLPVPRLQFPLTTPPTFVTELYSPGIPFEHNSPSDFFGQGCYNQGRPDVKNPYETVIYNRNQIALSGATNTTGQLNFLNFFDDANKTSFDNDGLNGITAIISRPGLVLIIGQNNNFIVGYNDTIARVDDQGQLVIPSNANAFGQPQTKTDAVYGCQPFDKNTIAVRQGLVHWVDSTECLVVQHNFDDGKPVSYNSVDGYIRAKIKALQSYNLNNANKMYFVGVVNPVNNEYLITNYIIKSNNFVNQERGINVPAQETIAFGIYSKVWKGWYSFTAEYYCYLQGELNDSQLFSFANGIGYYHYSANAANGYGQLYGQTVNRVFEIVVVMDNLRKKKPLSIGVMCKQSQYFADRVLTETGAQTRMLLSAWLQSEFGWYAPFLCDINTPPDPNRPIQTGANVLFDGNTIVGNFIKVRLIGDPSADTVYSELQGILITEFSESNNLNQNKQNG